MFLRNRVTGQVHEVPDHMVHGFYEVQEVDGFGEPLGVFPLLAALVPALTNILPAIGGLFKGDAPTPAPVPPPPVMMAPPPPLPPMESIREPIYPMRRNMVHEPEDDMPPPRRGPVPIDSGAPPAGPRPTVIYRRKRKGRRAVRRAPPSQVNGYGWWY